MSTPAADPEVSEAARKLAAAKNGAAAPPPEAKPDDGFAKAAEAETAKRKMEAEIRARVAAEVRKEMEAQVAAAAKERDEYKGKIATWEAQAAADKRDREIQEARLRADPREALKHFGFQIDTVPKDALPATDTAQRLAAMEADYKSKIAALEEQFTKRDEAAKAQRERAQQEAFNRYVADTDEFVRQQAADPKASKYPVLARVGKVAGGKLILDKINEQFEKDQRVLTREEAAAAVETDLAADFPEFVPAPPAAAAPAATPAAAAPAAGSGVAAAAATDPAAPGAESPLLAELRKKDLRSTVGMTPLSGGAGAAAGGDKVRDVAAGLERWQAERAAKPA